jgi:F0F1-type ATP synthase membrane subunit c/vacuolar-type H+-ATPase subunit K
MYAPIKGGTAVGVFVLVGSTGSGVAVGSAFPQSTRNKANKTRMNFLLFIILSFRNFASSTVWLI